MDHYIAKIHNNPAITGETFFFTFLSMSLTYVFHNGIRERIQHAVAGAGAEDEIICKGNNVFQVYENDIFALVIFKGIDNFTSKF